MNQGQTWLRADVAQGHVEMVGFELAVFERARAQAMAVMALSPLITMAPRSARFLDMGCGGAVYAGVIQRYFPNWKYHGFDFSQAMIDASLTYYRENGEYQVPSLQCLDLASAAKCPADVKDGLRSYDVVFASGSLEYCDHPGAVLQSLLVQVRMGAYFVLHKLRLVPPVEKKGRYLTEETYAGQTDDIWLWHLATLATTVSQFSAEWTTYTWPYDRHIITIVGRKTDDWLPF